MAGVGSFFCRCIFVLWKSQVKNLSEWKHHPVSSLPTMFFGSPTFSPCFRPIFGWRTPPSELISLIPPCVATFFGAISTMIRKQEASPTGRWWLPRELIPQLWPSVVRHSWHQWMVDDRSSPSLFFGCSKQMFDRRPCGLCFLFEEWNISNHDVLQFWHVAAPFWKCRRTTRSIQLFMNV